jgi:site-specific DNA recombinase
MKKIAKYTRVSSEESAEKGYSLSAQDERIDSYIRSSKEYMDAEIIHFTDEGISGAKGIEQRPGLKALFEAARSKHFDLVLVWRLDRFFRSTRKTLEAVDELNKYGVGLKSITEEFDTSNPTGRFMLTTLASIAELERETTMQRMDMGRERAIKSGIWLGGSPPYGYKINHDAKKLEINPEQAEVVKKIFKLLTEGRQTSGHVQSMINSMGIPTQWDQLGRSKKSKNWWNKRTITRILSNPIYTGRFEYHRKVKPQRGDYAENFNPPEKVIVGSVPQIIAQEEFDQAQSILRRNREMAARNTRRPYLFNKLVYCAECGRKWHGFTINRKCKDGHVSTNKYYQCNSYLTANLCNQRTLNENVFDDAIWSELMRLISKPEIVYREIEDRLNKANRMEEIKSELDEKIVLLNAERQRAKRLSELYIQGDIDKPEYDKRKRKYQELIDNLTARTHQMESQLKSLPSMKQLKYSVKQIYEKYLRRLYDLKYEDRAFIIHQLVSRVDYSFGEAVVSVSLPTYRLRDDRGIYRNTKCR